MREIALADEMFEEKAADPGTNSEESSMMRLQLSVVLKALTRFAKEIRRHCQITLGSCYIDVAKISGKLRQ